MLNQRQGLSYKILISILGVIVLIFIFKNKNNNAASENSPIEVMATNEIIENKPANSPLEKNYLTQEQEIQKCFSDYSSSDRLDELKNKLIQAYSLPEPEIDFEEYRMIGMNNESYRIHYDKNAPRNEVIRVYQIGADEMPDIIKNYPGSKSAQSNEQLDGALTLGTLQRKIIKMKTQSSEAVVLEYDEESREATSLRFVDQKNELVCNTNICHCKQY